MSNIRKLEPLMWEYKDFIIVQILKSNNPWTVFTDLGQFKGSFISKKKAIGFIDACYKE